MVMQESQVVPRAEEEFAEGANGPEGTLQLTPQSGRDFPALVQEGPVEVDAGGKRTVHTSPSFNRQRNQDATLLNGAQVFALFWHSAGVGRSSNPSSIRIPS